MRIASVIRCCSFCICNGSVFFGIPIPKSNMLFIDMDLCYPLASALVERNSFDPTTKIICARTPSVLHVLTLSNHTEICNSIICGIAVYMVNHLTRMYFSMH